MELPSQEKNCLILHVKLKDIQADIVTYRADIAATKQVCLIMCLRDAFKKKTDLRTLSQKVGGGPDQITKFVVCEIGT